MVIYSRLASTQGRRDDEPNKELGRELAETGDREAIEEIAKGLWHDEKAIRTDCIAVLEEVGQIGPGLIAGYVEDFINLLESKQNRLVWQAMINLALIAELCPVDIYDSLGAIKSAIEKGSVITVDNGVKTLARVAASNQEYQAEITPYLLDILRTCRTKSIPQYTASIQIAISEEIEHEFREILESRLAELSTAQQNRVNRLLR